MDKFAREKARKRDRVRDRGAYPFAYVIRKGDEYLYGEDAEREMRCHMAKAKAAKARPSQREKTIQKMFAQLSQKAKNEFGVKFFSHPETVVRYPIEEFQNGRMEVQIISSSQAFSHGLIRDLWNREHPAKR